MSMHTEYEAKFYPLPFTKDEFRKILEDHGAVCKVPERLMRRILFGKEVNTMIHADYLRVRDEGAGTISLSAKTHAVEGGDIADQKEVELKIDSFDEAVLLLETMGMQKTEYMENKRESWLIDGAHVEIDTWPGLPVYCEVEAGSEGEVKRIADLLGLDWEGRRITSVVEVYAEKYSLTKMEAKEKMKFLTFEKCDFLN